MNADSPNENDESERPDGIQGRAVALFLLSGSFAFLFWLSDQTIDSVTLKIAFMLCSAVVLSMVIWQACDPFADAAQWVGVRLKLPSSVRGATLDAIASSMPELFAGIFFVVVALTGVSAHEQRMAQAIEGFGSTIATCAGSSIYNMILIPAICAITISIVRTSRPAIELDDEVINRDGAWVLFTQFGLLVVLSLPAIHWWMGIAGIAVYISYVTHLYFHTVRFRKRSASADSLVERHQEINPSASILFGVFDVHLNGRTATMILGVCTLVVAVACYFLVELTNSLSYLLDVPAFFVAVILAAAVSSIPDTLLSVGSAKRGDDSGAISNVFGSNIFDICIGMSIPLLVCCYLNEWQPIRMNEGDTGTVQGVIGLRATLLVLTAIVMFTLWRYKKVTRKMGIWYVMLYGIFVLYAVLAGLGIVRF